MNSSRLRTRRSRPALAQLTEQLRRTARKITGPRQSILETLRRESHPLSIGEIFAALPAGECDLTTVYRSMYLLEKLGMVKRFIFSDGRARFELLSAEDAGHHHHLVCVECASVVELDECFPEEWENRIAQRNGFKSVTHRLEFFGVCPQCQSAGPPAGCCHTLQKTV